MPSIGSKIFDYSKRELEDKADRFIACRPFLGSRPPIYADLILARMPDVKCILDVDELLQPKFKTAAMVMARRFMHQEFTVLVDQEIMNRRDGVPFNMAIAEELAHIELHRAVILDIQGPEDFLELQRHPRWSIAEHDAKYFGRALLMPGAMLERISGEAYQGLVAEIGFGEPFRLERMFILGMARAFLIPPEDAERRITAYPGAVRERLAKSITARSSSLLSLFDDVVVRAAEVSESETIPDSLLWGDGN